MWMITYKSGDGRTVAMVGQFDTKELAERYIEAKGFSDIMHAVETDGKVKVRFLDNKSPKAPE